MTMLMGFRLVVQNRGAAGLVRLEGGWWGTEDPSRMDRRFGVKIGVMEGGLFPIIKTQKKGLAGGFIRQSLCCFPWGPQWELEDHYSAEAH